MGKNDNPKSSKLISRKEIHPYCYTYPSILLHKQLRIELNTKVFCHSTMKENLYSYKTIESPQV